MRRMMWPVAICALVALSPCWAYGDDQQILDSIIAKLQAERDKGNLEDFRVDVEVDSGIVWMKGQVKHPQHEQLVLEAARYVSGVTRVVDAIEVAGSQVRPVSNTEPAELEPTPAVSSEPANDPLAEATPLPASRNETPSRGDQRILDEIVHKVRAKQSEGLLRGFPLNVTVTDGVVRMDGDVKNMTQQAQLLDIARRIAGVRQVVNGLTVNGQKFRSLVQQASQLQQAGPLPTAPAMPQGMAAGPLPQGPPPQYVAGLHRGNAMGPAPGMTPVSMPAQYGGNQYPQGEHPSMPGYSWPSYAAYPNFAGVTYPQQYSPTAWPYIGPFYPYPQVPLGWRKVSLEWDDGWWFLDFWDKSH